MSRRLVDGKQPKPGPNANKGGRRSELELKPELVEKIEAAVRIGAPVLTAAALQGVSYEALRQWVIKGVKDPNSLYGAFIQTINRAAAQWEVGDLAVIHSHANGKPAEYEREVVRDEKGKIVYTTNEKGEQVPLMQIARDGEGNPIVRSPAIKSDWRAALERLSRRKPKHWARRDQLAVSVDHDDVLRPQEAEVNTKGKLSFEQEVANAMVKFDEDF